MGMARHTELHVMDPDRMTPGLQQTGAATSASGGVVRRLALIQKTPTFVRFSGTVTIFASHAGGRPADFGQYEADI